ncbi:hypothetical protein TRP8649_01384 [Pelagimonas phthalicica]|uniref:Phage DNA packaging protein, Nu1 subunit of terminase n=1 Tax=Pelagimonas phthalicica TaxID=1037362 RepID=A0A238J987_9RHOB|nr:phage terminase Nu1 subunit (DNA packaging protein) [Pelagimonas phthalicica]SMX27281.1 hypothetical protein TRP8649_01384 [Pelagimonas phthalicica]
MEEIARLLKLTPRRVQQLAEEGVIPKSARGKYKITEAVQGYIGYLQTKVQAPQGESKNALNEARVRKTVAEAEIAEMEAAKMRGDLVDADEMREALGVVVSEIRANLLRNVPTRIASRAKSERKESAIKAIAKDEISLSLRRLSETDPNDLVGVS